eukprot:GHVS01061755.1.p1 GENE.GHVS01061755.1~~GHVS01061755.1.p1  ORF type:complete len:137 (+),score=6.79 GHVS01061755.1:209-619(+)
MGTSYGYATEPDNLKTELETYDDDDDDDDDGDDDVMLWMKRNYFAHMKGEGQESYSFNLGLEKDLTWLSDTGHTKVGSYGSCVFSKVTVTFPRPKDSAPEAVSYVVVQVDGKKLFVLNPHKLVATPLPMVKVAVMP